MNQRSADLLAAVLDTSACEIYIVDCATLLVLAASASACANLRRDIHGLRSLTLPALAYPESSTDYRALLRPLDEHLRDSVQLDTLHVRADGCRYPVTLHIRRYAAEMADAGDVDDVDDADDQATHPGAIYVVSGIDQSEREAAAGALQQSQNRFHAIVSNTPGLVFQCTATADGAIAFPYLSDGCHALLGIGAEQLQADAGHFVGLILAPDRSAFLTSMQASAQARTAWNWDGRIWIEAWKDIKWINLRATPRALAGDAVQWEGIMTNITQSKLEEAEIKKSRAQLAELSAHVDTVKEQERTRIAREIHDDLGGNLTAIKMSLALLTRRLPADPTMRDKAEYLNSLVDRTIESVHRISGDLRPGMLDFGLVAAIDWQMREFEKQLGLRCEFSSNRKEIDLHPDQATALFRVFQEALTNISKHAGASVVQVELSCGSRNVQMQISDNGRGIADADRLKAKSFGIRGMVERASALGGSLTISAGADGGSVVLVRVPLRLDALAPQ